jgi:hypothetical protein
MIRILRALCASAAVFALLCGAGIRVANAQVKPAAVKNVDEPGRIPYMKYVAAARGSANCGTNFCDFVLPAIPVGKRLVITGFAGNMAFAGTATASRVTLQVDATNGPIFELPLDPALYHVDNIAIGSPNRAAFNEKILLFAEAGQTPWISMYTTGSLVNSWPQGFIVSGYLVDLTM